MANQLKRKDQLTRRAEAKPTPTPEHSFSGSSAFTNFIRARDCRVRRGSLDEPMPPVAPTAIPHMLPPYTPPRQKDQPTSAQQFMPLGGHGLKTPKPRDPDWISFAKFSGKETHLGMGPTSIHGGCVFCSDLARQN
uniref:Uncharacterized protein n=1 Tax=Peronospora matthiolae TaxID=2874970 RepID=A0AAV1VMD3_9STRA